MKKIGGVFAFKVKDGPNGQEATWVVDVKNGKGCVHNDQGEKTWSLHVTVSYHLLSVPSKVETWSKV